MQTDRHARPPTRLDAAAWALLVTQLLHGFTPADTSSEGWFGAVVGGVLLVATGAAIVGLRARSTWARGVAGATGAVVAVGFVAYHATPFRSPVTNPYVGEPVGAPAWISVALAIAAGAWTAHESRVAARTPAGAGPGSS